MSCDASEVSAWLTAHLRIDQHYSRLRKYLPVGTFFAGFLWDSLTLTRIDRVFDNLILLGYLTALAVLIVLTLRIRAGSIQVSRFRKLEPHCLGAMQFLLGGLLSSYVVFYFKSASWTQTSVFLALLVVILIGNEFLEHRLGNSKLLVVMFFFSLFSFLAFFLPVVLNRVGQPIFILAGFISLGVTLWVFTLAFFQRKGPWWQRIRSVSPWIIGVYAALHMLYFGNLIPPVPLSLKSAGIFHRLSVTERGYQVQYVPPPWHRFWKKWDDPFYLSSGETVYCYTAIFAPRRIQVPVQHLWSRYESGKGWMQTDRIQFQISGGREGGYRGYSFKRALTPGKWRVEVETGEGQILGRIDFNVIATDTGHPELKPMLIP